MVKLSINLLWLAILLCVGCDAPSNVQSTLPVKHVLTTVELRPLIVLNIGKPTHLDIDPAGVLFWVQEDPDSEDVVFQMGNDGIPRSTGLNDREILSRMQATGGQGTIQSIRCVGDNKLLFYFVGGKDARLVACVGSFDVRTGEMDVMLDTDRLMAVTGMGYSIELARGSLGSTRDACYLFLRHTDAASLLRWDKFRPSLGWQKFDLSDDTGPVDLRDPKMIVVGQNNGSLTVTDLKRAKIWEVQPGEPWTEVLNLAGMPREISEPVVDGNNVVLFIAGGDPIEPVDVQEKSIPPVESTYPAIVLREGRIVRTITPDHWVYASGVTPERMHLSTLLKDVKPDTWIAYDIPSGTILRISGVDGR